MLFDDSYQTIAKTAEGFFKDKGSKFLAYAYHLKGESEAKKCLGELRELHRKAVHHCYAYRVPGLINAYKTATELALDEAEIVTRHLAQTYEMIFPYLEIPAKVSQRSGKVSQFFFGMEVL